MSSIAHRMEAMLAKQGYRLFIERYPELEGVTKVQLSIVSSATHGILSVEEHYVDQDKVAVFESASLLRTLSDEMVREAGKLASAAVRIENGGVRP